MGRINMNEVIVAIISACVSSTIAFLLTRKYTVGNSDLETVRKVFTYQKQLYLDIVENKMGQPISSEIAKIRINKLITEMSKADELFLAISEETRQCLAIYESSTSNAAVQNVQRRLKNDFEETKYKLGYPNNVYGQKLYNFAKIAQIVSASNILFFLAVLLFHWYANANILWQTFYWTAFMTLILFCSSLYAWEHATFDAYFRKRLIEYIVHILRKALHIKDK